MSRVDVRTELVRGGSTFDTVHRADCKRLGRRVVPWNWAEGKSSALIATAAANGLKFCKVCKPLERRSSP